MYQLKIDSALDKKLLKLSKKNKKQLELFFKKVEEIRMSPTRYKNLRAPLQNWKRVHIDKHFVLTFSFDEKNKIIILEDYDYHDNIYLKT